MKILFIPQVNHEYKTIYEFEDEVIKCTIGGKTDTFDFRELPDGELEVFELESGECLVSTDLDFQPIFNARKTGGIVYVELLNFIDNDATEEERFPDWIDHTEYKPPETANKDDTNEEEEESSNGENEVEE